MSADEIKKSNQQLGEVGKWATVMSLLLIYNMWKSNLQTVLHQEEKIFLQ